MCSSVRPPKYCSVCRIGGTHTLAHKLIARNHHTLNSTPFRFAPFRAAEIWSLLALAFAHKNIAHARRVSHFVVRKSAALLRQTLCAMLGHKRNQKRKQKRALRTSHNTPNNGQSQSEGEHCFAPKWSLTQNKGSIVGRSATSLLGETLCAIGLLLQMCRNQANTTRNASTSGSLLRSVGLQGPDRRYDAGC